MAEGGMPQLAFGNPLTFTQVLWGVPIFVLLYILVSRVALPQVAQVLDQRSAMIRTDLDTANAAKARADAAAAEMAATTAQARAEAQAAISKAMELAQAQAAADAAVLNEKLEVQIKAAEARIATARVAAMSALRDVALSTATTVLGRLTGISPDSGAVAGAVDRALSARGQG